MPRSAVQRSDSVIHIYKFSFYILFHYGLPQDVEYSFLCYTVSKTWLFIHSKCDSLHLPTPNSQSIPLPPLTPWQPQICSLWVLFCSSCHILNSTYKWYHIVIWYHSFPFWLISLSMIISSCILSLFCNVPKATTSPSLSRIWTRVAFSTSHPPCLDLFYNNHLKHKNPISLRDDGLISRRVNLLSSWWQQIEWPGVPAHLTNCLYIPIYICRWVEVLFNAGLGMWILETVS